MTESDIEVVIARQAELIAALDAGDITQIQSTTAALAAALAAIRAKGEIEPGLDRDRVGYALKQSEAAKIRVNYLADRTRRRLDRLGAGLGGRASSTYNSAGFVRAFG